VVRYKVVMEPNTNMTDVEGEDIYNVTYPLYALYLKFLFRLSLGGLVFISSLIVICAILKDKKLRNTHNLLIVNLLISDLLYAVFQNSTVVYLTVIYLFDVNFNANCNVIVPFILVFLQISKLMIIPLTVHRFISIAWPFSHKRILTKKKIIIMIMSLCMLAVFFSIVFSVGNHVIYIPSLAACTVTNTSIVTFLTFVVPDVVSIVILAIVSAYLHSKIIKSNRFIHNVQRNASERQRAIKASQLMERLREQIKPTLSVLISGGIDAIFDLLVIVVHGVASSQASPVTYFQIIQIIALPLGLCQTLTHPLCFGLYNKEIRKKVITCYPKQSRVIVLNNGP